MDLSKIPKAGVIDVADAPDITYTELMRQIVDNVSAQINFLDEEISNANSAEKATAQVSTTLIPNTYILVRILLHVLTHTHTHIERYMCIRLKCYMSKYTK